MKKYNVADFGALPGTGKTVTGSLQSALDTCFLSGGGIVEIPCGEYLTGGLRLRSNTELHLCAGAKLIGTRNPEDYNILGSDTVEPVDLTAGYATKWNNGLIRILKAENVKITGEDDSLICGSNCYDPTGEENYRGPHAISCWFSKNLSFSGYTVRDSANWAHSIWHSENIMADNLHVYAGHDGFHIRGCKNTEIRSSDFITGDDAIAGHGNVNVLVADCNLNTACSAFITERTFLWRDAALRSLRKSVARLSDRLGKNKRFKRFFQSSAQTFAFKHVHVFCRECSAYKRGTAQCGL